MTFRASDEIPRLSWRDLHAVNAMVKPEDGSKPLNDLRMHHRRWMERGLMHAVSASTLCCQRSSLAPSLG